MTYAYNRLGQNTSVVQGAGGTALSTLLDRCVCGKVTRETLDPTFFGSQILTYKLDSTGVGTKGRTTGFQLGVPDSPALYADFTYDYDTLGRFQSLHQGSSYEFVNYTYVPNSGLIQAVEVPGGSQLFTYDDHRDHLKSVQSNAGRNLARVQYQIDALGRRTSALHDGELFARFSGGGHHSRYGYNDRSEVTSAQSWTGLDLNNESPVSALGGRKFDFEFDPIGNRTTSQVDNRVTAYTPNELNQYASRTVPRAVDVTGLAAATASVTVNGAAASRVGDYFYSTQTAPSNAAAWLTANIAATPGGTQTRNVYVPATPEIFVYDLDGNLTADSRWTYTWDAENRLTSMETMVAAYSVGVPRQFLSFKYDYLGRRIRKTVANWNGTAYVAAVDRKFIFDGWNLIAECDALTTLTMVRTYTWGLDISRTLADAGGVHGLLLVRDWATGQSHRTVYDGNGNLLGLVETASGAVSAQYEYSPFGETIRATGSYAAANPFRFSTKFTDDETGLVYYGRRYYSPSQGRFVGRDPIEEKGGRNLYGFCGNNGVNRFDVLGMAPIVMAPFVVTGTKIADPSIDWQGLFGGGGTVENFHFDGGGSGVGPLDLGKSIDDALGIRRLTAAELAGNAENGLYYFLWNVDTGNFDAYAATRVLTQYAFVNGITGDLADHARLAESHITSSFKLTAGDNLTSFTLFNNPASGKGLAGVLGDIWEGSLDKLGFTTAPAKALADVLQATQAAGHATTWIAHSQGGAIFSQAMNYAAANGATSLSANTVQFNAGVNNWLVTNSIARSVGVSVTGYYGSPLDAVPNVGGLNGNLLTIPLSTILLPTLFFKGPTSHTQPRSDWYLLHQGTGGMGPFPPGP